MTRRWLLLSVALVALPFGPVRFVPCTDLPQHLAQIRLLEEAWGLAPPTVDFSNLEVHVLAPNTLVYWPVFALARVLDPAAAGRLAVLLLAVATALALHRLARRRGRSGLAVVLASLLVFSAPLYWGLLPFLAGLPLFLLLVERNLRPPPQEEGARELLISALLALALLWAHVLWLAAATVCAAAEAARRRDPWSFAWRALGFAPAALWLALWTPSLAASRRASGFDVSMHYFAPIAARLEPGWLVQGVLGGLRGWLEPIAAAALLGYAAASFAPAFRARTRDLDAALLAAGAALFAFAFLAPDKYLNTILFGSRFLPCAAMLVLLALPPVRGATLALAFACGAVVFSLATALAWWRFDERDLSGLAESLGAVDAPRSVLGLDLRQRSQDVRGRPFLQTFAYFQAVHGGETYFSFAEHGIGLVTTRARRPIAWSPGLAWFPERATPRDLEAFDCTLVNGDDSQHRSFRAETGLAPRMEEGHFRLYCRR